MLRLNHAPKMHMTGTVEDRFRKVCVGDAVFITLSQTVNRPTVQDLEQLTRAAVVHSVNPPPSLFSSSSAVHQQTLWPCD